MVALKGRSVDAFLARPDASAGLILVYGPDSGLVSERARQVAAASLDDRGDPFALVTLDAETLAADPARLADEAHTISLFGGRRVIRVRAGGADLSASFRPLFSKRPADATIVVDAGDLKPASPLRKLFEADKTAIAIPCYPDAERDLARVVDEALREARLSIATDARALLMQGLGGDRLATRLELEKLCLYAAGQGRIETGDVMAVMGDVSALRNDDIVDAAADGDRDRLAATYLRALAAGTDAGAVALAASRYFDLLLRVKLEAARGKSVDGALGSARPPLHFRRRDAAKRQVERWSEAALTSGLDRLSRTVFEARRNPALAAELVERALLEIAVQARRAADRR